MQRRKRILRCDREARTFALRVMRYCGPASAVETLLEEIPSSPPFKGILHAAGVVDDHSLLEQSFASFLRCARPKWSGAWNLHTLTRSQKLDFFVLFSSGAALDRHAGTGQLQRREQYARRAGRVSPRPWTARAEYCVGPMDWCRDGQQAMDDPAEHRFRKDHPDEGSRPLETILTTRGQSDGAAGCSHGIDSSASGLRVRRPFSLVDRYIDA